MYKKNVPFKDYNNTPRTMEVQFNLEVHEVLKLMVQFKAIYAWQESIGGAPRELETEQVVEFYNNFEDIILEAYGKVSEDGLSFKKGDRYTFQESKLFAETMELFLKDPQETGKLLDGIMPPGLESLVKSADDNLAALAANPATPDAMRAQISQLQAQLDNSNSEVVRPTE